MKIFREVFTNFTVLCNFLDKFSSLPLVGDFDCYENFGVKVPTGCHLSVSSIGVFDWSEY